MNNSPLLFNLIFTKITPQVSRSNHVQRPRLVERLLAWIQYSLTTLVAAAGFGKTTLLGQRLICAIKDGWQVAWVSLFDIF
jgi:ATP/maltotriose-dependent transcriptional regulator MalT